MAVWRRSNPDWTVTDIRSAVAGTLSVAFATSVRSTREEPLLIQHGDRLYRVGSTRRRLSAPGPRDSNGRFRAMKLKSGLTEPDPLTPLKR
jgi:hypothetical protein